MKNTCSHRPFFIGTTLLCIILGIAIYYFGCKDAKNKALNELEKNGCFTIEYSQVE